MKMLVTALAVCLAGCMTARWGDVPTPVEGQPDTYRFKITGNAFVSKESYLYEKLTPDLETFRVERGYKAFSVVDRACQPMGGCVYAVRFTR